MEKQLSQQEIIDSTTLQLELLKSTDEILKPSLQEKQRTVAAIFDQFDLNLQQGLIIKETREKLINLWLDNYLLIDNLDSNSRN